MFETIFDPGFCNWFSTQGDRCAKVQVIWMSVSPWEMAAPFRHGDTSFYGWGFTWSIMVMSAIYRSFTSLIKKWVMKLDCITFMMVINWIMIGQEKRATLKSYDITSTGRILAILCSGSGNAIDSVGAAQHGKGYVQKGEIHGPSTKWMLLLPFIRMFSEVLGIPKLINSSYMLAEETTNCNFFFGQLQMTKPLLLVCWHWQHWIFGESPEKRGILCRLCASFSERFIEWHFHGRGMHAGGAQDVRSFCVWDIGSHWHYLATESRVTFQSVRYWHTYPSYSSTSLFVCMNTMTLFTWCLYHIRTRTCLHVCWWSLFASRQVHLCLEHRDQPLKALKGIPLKSFLSTMLHEPNPAFFCKFFPGVPFSKDQSYDFGGGWCMYICIYIYID